MRRTPLEIASALGLKHDGRPFDWAHLGASELPIGALLGLIRETPGLSPPRSGHLGNWEDIALGRAGAMDFNHAICKSKLGHPFIYCFNQTEDLAMEAGDWVYLPGSIASRGERHVLPLFTWDGEKLARRGCEAPLFVPFVVTEEGGERLPLTQLHWRRMQKLEGLEFRLEAAFIHERRDRVRPMLAALVDEACRRDNPRRALSDLVSHAASLDGRVARASLVREGSGFRLDDVVFASTDALVDAVMQPFAAVAEPDRFFADLARLPAKLPVMSSLLVGVFSAIFGTHYPDAAIDRASMTQPFNPHFHWGARDMAGYPPKRNGYFGERSTIKSYRQIMDTLAAKFADVDPVYFLLMPAAAFMLCPADAHARDVDALGALFHDVTTETASLAGTTDDRMMNAVDRVVRAWLGEAESGLSPYFKNRFSARRGVLHETDVPAKSTSAEPDGFRGLSMKQACMIVGALTEALGETPSKVLGEAS